MASAGIPGHPGRDMDPEMAKQLRARGGEPNGHVSRSLTTDMLALADLVITFELAQRLRILESHPGWTHKLFGLHQLVDALERTSPASTGVRLVDDAHRACAPDSMTWDVPDPYGRGRAAARKAADEIDEALAVIVRCNDRPPGLTVSAPPAAGCRRAAPSRHRPCRCRTRGNPHA